MADGDSAEFDRFDAVVADNDTQQGSGAVWRAANAVYEKAELVERLDGADAALDLYADVVRRLRGCREPGPRELLACAMNNIASIHHESGRDRESRVVAEDLVHEHFDEPPRHAIPVVVDGALLLGRLLNEAGEHEQALLLYDRIVDQYGQRGVPDAHRTAAAANSSAAWALGSAGRLDEAIQRYGIVIGEIDDTTEPVLRRILAGAMVRRAHLLREKGRVAESDAVCDEVVRRFAGDDNPEIADHVTWARREIAAGSKRLPRRGRPRRRG